MIITYIIGGILVGVGVSSVINDILDDNRHRKERREEIMDFLKKKLSPKDYIILQELRYN